MRKNIEFLKKLGADEKTIEAIVPHIDGIPFAQLEKYGPVYHKNGVLQHIRNLTGNNGDREIIEYRIPNLVRRKLKLP